VLETYLIDLYDRVMHELSIAISIVDTAIAHLEMATAERVAEVELDIGTLSGIEYELLESALGIASRKTVLEKTKFRINRVEPVAECPVCENLYTPDRIYSSCPECKEEGIRLIRGTESKIKSLLVEQNE
jgi:hydrogenase nickel incorporation protein HypA/HybF